MWTLSACSKKEHGRMCVWRDSVIEAVRFWSGFVQCEEMLFSGSQGPLGSALDPCHLLESPHMGSAVMCVWWRCVWLDRYFALFCSRWCPLQSGVQWFSIFDTWDCVWLLYCMLCAPHRVSPTVAEGLLCVGMKPGNTGRGEWFRVTGNDWV